MMSNATGDRALRDFGGYGGEPPVFSWPGKRQVAVNFAINLEEGTERSPLLGDDARDSRTWIRSVLPSSERDLLQESEYEYGSRVGIWRLLRIFRQFDVPFSVFLSSDALSANPLLIDAVRDADCDIVSHGTRSISRVGWSEQEERDDLRRSIDETFELTGKRVLGAFPRPPITLRSRRLMAAEGLLYDSASTNDDRPHFDRVLGRPFLVLPYALDTNDARFWGGQTGPGFVGATDFFDYLKSSFETLVSESATSATMMSVGLHSRIMRPGRVAALTRFLEYVTQKDAAWVAKRNDIAFHFARQFAPSDTWNLEVIP